MHKLLYLLVAFLLCACSESGTITSSTYVSPSTNPSNGVTNTTTTSNATVVPGVTFSVVDFYTSGSYVYLVLKNNTAAKTVSFSIDYSAQCGSGSKKYGSIYTSLGSYEQSSQSIFIGSGTSSSCSLTMSAIRSSYTGFIPWNGSYTVTTSMFK